jgi:hypothetical protein
LVLTSGASVRLLVLSGAVLVLSGVCRGVGIASPDAGLNPAAVPHVPIALIRNKTVVPVRFQGVRELHLILDSGMGFDGLLLFDPGLRDSLGSRNLTVAKIPGAGGGPPSEAFVADSLAFRVGDVRFESQRVIIPANDALGSPEIAGVIGYSLLGHYAVEIDFDTLTLALRDPQTFEPGPGWTSLPLAMGRNNLPYLEVSASVGDERPIPLKAYIDCASSEAIEFLLRPSMRFTVPLDAEEAYLGRGLSVDIHGRRGRIARLILGPHELRNVVAAFAPAEVRSKAGGADAVLANSALRRFNLVYDYVHARLFVRPNGHFGDRFD